MKQFNAEKVLYINEQFYKLNSLIRIYNFGLANISILTKHISNLARESLKGLLQNMHPSPTPFADASLAIEWRICIANPRVLLETYVEQR